MPGWVEGKSGDPSGCPSSSPDPPPPGRVEPATNGVDVHCPSLHSKVLLSSRPVDSPLGVYIPVGVLGGGRTPPSSSPAWGPKLSVVGGRSPSRPPWNGVGEVSSGEGGNDGT